MGLAPLALGLGAYYGYKRYKRKRQNKLAGSKTRDLDDDVDLEPLLPRADGLPSENLSKKKKSGKQEEEEEEEEEEVEEEKRISGRRPSLLPFFLMIFFFFLPSFYDSFLSNCSLVHLLSSFCLPPFFLFLFIRR